MMAEHWTKRFSKAVTLSYDDGIESDVRLVEILREYDVKCTFNLNSGLGTESCWDYKGFRVQRMHLPDCTALYQGHEIAVHGALHRHPTELTDAQLDAEYVDDRAALARIFGTEPVGMAYAYGDYNDTVVEKLRGMGIRYGRTVEGNHDFAPQSDLLHFHPTCHHDDEMLFPLIERFLALPAETPAIFYLWGHAYEFDGNHNWDRLRRALERLAGHKDIFYGTNAQVLLG